MTDLLSGFRITLQLYSRRLSKVWSRAKNPVPTVTTYYLKLEDIGLLADALAQLDGPGCPSEWKPRIEQGHRALIHSLGDDVYKVYGYPDDEIDYGVK